MLEINGYFNDFINSIDNVIDKNTTIVEINIINEILSLIKKTIFYIIPQHIEDYPFNKNLVSNYDLEQTLIIESEIESYELISKNTRMKTFTPTIYISIKENNNNFQNLNLLINSKYKIRDNLTIVVRKHNGNWQIPPIAFNFYDNKLNIIELFLNRYFDFQQSQKHISVQECLKIITKKTNDIYKNNISTILNKKVDYLNYQKNNLNYKIPSFLLLEKNKIDLNIQTLRMEDDNNYKGALDDIYYFGIRL